ncbi:MAG: ABC transporter ATP-binding protein [Calditrichia bacterium]
MSKSTILELKNITKNYYTKVETIEVLKGISLSVRQSEMISIMGPSGVGKSTLLHIMGSLDKPTEGQVVFNGQLIHFSDDEFLNRFRLDNVGFIFQFHHLLPEFNALENVMIPMLISGKTDPRQAEEKATGLLKKVELGHRMNHKPNELSGGEQQRVAIARALANDPDLILADEPTGNLDEKHGNEVFDLLLHLKETLGKTLILVTHNRELAEKTDRIIELKDGLIAN